MVLKPSVQLDTRSIVYSALIAAAYVVLTLVLAPIGYGPIQLRVAGLLMAAALLSPTYVLGLAVGVGLANLTSPFGAWDFLAMPLVSYGAGLLAYTLRHFGWGAVLLQASVTAIGVTLFPLYMGGGIPVWPTVAFVWVSNTLIFLAGWFVIWRNLKGRNLNGNGLE